MPFVIYIEWWNWILALLPTNRKFSTGLLALITPRTTPLRHYAWALCLCLCQGALSYMLSVSHWWRFPACIHSARMTVSIISRWDFVFNMTFHYYTRKKPVGSAKQRRRKEIFCLGGGIDQMYILIPMKVRHWGGGSRGIPSRTWGGGWRTLIPAPPLKHGGLAPPAPPVPPPMQNPSQCMPLAVSPVFVQLGFYPVGVSWVRFMLNINMF